jgi:hypothetical protein
MATNQSCAYKVLRNLLRFPLICPALQAKRGVVRHIKSVYKLMEMDGKEAPPRHHQHKRVGPAAERHLACRQLTAAGKGIRSSQCWHQSQMNWRALPRPP